MSIKTRALFLGAAVTLLAGAVLSSQLPARAQQYPATLPPNVGTADCDKACLNDLAEKFMAALVAHDPSKLPLAKNARYSEDGVHLPMPDGLWKNATSILPYRLFITDPEWGSVAWFARMTENGAPILLSARLKVYNHQITEIEVMVGRGRGPTPIPVPGAPPPPPRPDLLGTAPRPEFLQEIAPKDRRSRDDLMKIANTYWTGIENNTGVLHPRFAYDCKRYENGMQTTGNPLPPGREKAQSNMTCIDGFADGYSRNDTRLRNRRIVAVDLERQLVAGATCFDHDNTAAVRNYKLNDGQAVTVADTNATTLCTYEFFQINKDGNISQIEAVLLSPPYGMQPYFDTGFHMDSPQANKDGYQEYP